MTNATLGIIGCGSMGGAIARGLVDSGTLDAELLACCDEDGGRLAPLAELGATVFVDATEMLQVSDPHAVILAVKPQVLPAVAAKIASQLTDRLVISIAAGVPIAKIERLLPESRVVRVMPNLPIQVRSGASAIARGTRATADDVALVTSLFGALGVAEVMREDQLDVDGAVLGCGPAFFALMVDALTRAGVRAGLPCASCRAMVAATMAGVAQQILDGEHPRAYMDKVTSPAGTTAEALYALEPLLMQGAYDAVDAALERTRELAGS